jgi:hypothetical protein
MKYCSTKFVPFKKLLEIKNSRRIYFFNWMERWILGCYKNYIINKLNSTTPVSKRYNENWWKGCLKKYYNEKYIN